MICRKCKNELKEGEQFCSKCGTKVKFEQEKERILNSNNNIEKLKIWKLILLVVVIITIIALVVCFVKFYKTNNNDNSSNNIFKTTQNNNIKKGNKEISFSNLKNNKEELAKLTEEQRLVIDYFNNDYFEIWDTERLERYPSIFKGANVRIEGFVAKVLKSSDDEFEALVYPFEHEAGGGNIVALEADYDDNMIVVNASQVVERFKEGDPIVVYGTSNTVKDYEINNKTYNLANIQASSIEKTIEKYTKKQAEKIAKGIFGNNIKVRDADMNVDYIDPFPCTVITLENQSNLDFKMFDMSRMHGKISYHITSPEMLGLVNKQLFISSDFEHFIVTTYDTKSKKGYVDYYDKSFNKIWGIDFYSESTSLNSNVMPFDHNNSMFAINIDNELHLIDINTGENIIEPLIVGQKSAVLLKDDKIILVGVENKDIIMEVDFNGNIIRKYDGNTTMQDITGISTQTVNNRTIIQVYGKNYRNEVSQYKIIVLKENGELEISTEDQIIASY